MIFSELGLIKSERTFSRSHQLHSYLQLPYLTPL